MSPKARLARLEPSQTSATKNKTPYAPRMIRPSALGPPEENVPGHRECQSKLAEIEAAGETQMLERQPAEERLTAGEESAIPPRAWRIIG